MTTHKQHSNSFVAQHPVMGNSAMLPSRGVLVNRGGLPTDLSARVGGDCCFTRGVYQHIFVRNLTVSLAIAIAGINLSTAFAVHAIGSDGKAGCRGGPKKVDRLSIKSPGVYENWLVDGDWGESTLVKIVADDVTLRNCEIHRGRHNAVLVVGKNVLIESCKIHHVLAGTFQDQKDAHGITGQPTKLVIRNCEISHVSGDCLQFDPGRGAWDDVLVENCTFKTGPLESDAAWFKKGERPGGECHRHQAKGCQPSQPVDDP